jgi:uncharacterized protein (DUF1330 family)
MRHHIRGASLSTSGHSIRFRSKERPSFGWALSDGGSGFKVVAGGKNVTIEGTPPKARYVIVSYENMDKAIAAYNSPAFKEARKIGDKYASSFRIIAVEAPQ